MSHILARLASSQSPVQLPDRSPIACAGSSPAPARIGAYNGERPSRAAACRWQIEVFHRSLKREGLRGGRLQVKDVGRLQRALAVYQGVAVELLEVLHASREEPDQPAVEVFEPEQLTVLALATKRPVATLREAVGAVATLGGWPGYPRSPRPGITVFSDGYHALELLVLGYRLARGQPPPPEFLR